MFDNISFQIENYSQADFQSLIENWILAEPKVRSNWLQVDWHNLRINYFPRQLLLKASNSLHKFFNAEILGIGEVNNDDFTFNKVVETIRYLQEAFKTSPDKMRLVGRFEYGVNISTADVKPFDIIDRYQSIVTTATNPFHAFYNPYGKPYGKFCAFTHYSVKCYDKGKQMGISGGNIFRYEIVHNSAIQTKKIFQKAIPTLNDLGDKTIWQRCYKFIRKTLESIRVLAFPQDGVDAYSKTLAYSFATLNRDFRKSLKQNFKLLVEAHDRVKYNSHSPHTLINKGIEDKFNLIFNQDSAFII